MYPGYEQYWLLAILADPAALSCRSPAGSRLPARLDTHTLPTRHRTSSCRQRSRQLAWPIARILRSVDEIRLLKQQPGKDIHAIGGATLISSLMNMELIDEIRLVMHPVVLGGGKALFKDVERRHALELSDVGRLASGPVRLTYRRRHAAA